MCGIFGVITSTGRVRKESVAALATAAERRGRDSSGLLFDDGGNLRLVRADVALTELLEKEKPFDARFVIGHSRLITNGMDDNQPVSVGSVRVVHNGIITNEQEMWEHIGRTPDLSIDTEVIAAFVDEYLSRGHSLEHTADALLKEIKGILNCAILVPELAQLLLISNTGSLYLGSLADDLVFFSERHPLETLGCSDIRHLVRQHVTVGLPTTRCTVESNIQIARHTLISDFKDIGTESGLLEYREHALRRCTKCILPSTMPFIVYDEQGVCNYCHSYKLRNQPKPLADLVDLLEGYARNGQTTAIIPFSGGRDSSFALHLAVKELGLTAITYTYDWGMVTDLGRRNISRMCSALSSENIVIAADIEKKRRYIAKNLRAWLETPHLGLLSLLTAGDKYFFKHLPTVQRETGVSLNLWGINPLETTHFKAGFLGIAPDFASKNVYRGGFIDQLRYHRKRFGAMSHDRRYFNSSLPDTLAGEYWRSVHKKVDYHHIFDYWQWDEAEIDEVLLNQYDWETAVDTRTTWRIGDGTAAFYNYANYTLAGFTEHDTFRSNQIREGQIDRQTALDLVAEENQPRYQNIRWYLDLLGFNFENAVRAINSAPKVPPFA